MRGESVVARFAPIRAVSRSRAALAVCALVLAVAAACGAANTPTNAPEATEPPSASATPRPSPTAEPVVVDLDAVPAVDLEVHSVPLEEVVFDTFDGGFTRLSDASQRLMRSLRDAIRPIYNPRYGAVDGLTWLRDSDLVIGYESGGSAYAYPVKILNRRELVNDVIDGVPVLVSYCPLCGSGAVYSRDLDGRTLLFGNTSALYESDLVMYDHETGSYWFQVLGEAIVGDMSGSRLTLLPSVTISWGEWRRIHPQTRLLLSDGEEAFGSSYAPDSSIGYTDFLDSGRFAFPVSPESLDDRLKISELVITVEVGSAVKAYPVALIGDAAVNDRVGGTPVVVFSREASGGAFFSTVDGKELTFDVAEGGFMDRETASIWNRLGRAVKGPMDGATLESVPSRRGFWFSVAGALPGIDLYLP